MGDRKVPACVTSRLKPKKKKIKTVHHRPACVPVARDVLTYDLLESVRSPKQVGVELRCSQRSDGTIMLRMESSTNGMKMCEIQLNSAQFGRLVSTQGAIEVQAEMSAISVTESTAVKHVEHVVLPKRRSEYKTKDHVRAALDEVGYKDWEIYHDGLSSQQNGDGHQCTVIRFEVPRF
jgi:hypothetical protein